MSDNHETLFALWVCAGLLAWFVAVTAVVRWLA